MQHTTTNEEDTKKLGMNFGQNCHGGEVFLLVGELGTGKTQFAKGLAEGLGVAEYITSPTFNYENIYQAQNNLTFYHFDLYREEVLDPDIEALFYEAIGDKKGVVLVEWAERAEKIWPKGAKLIHFNWKSENERELTVETV